MLDFRLHVRVVAKETGMPLPGLFLKVSLPFIRHGLQAAILVYIWCRPSTCFSSTTLPFSTV
jgi:hypothetical protein